MTGGRFKDFLERSKIHVLVPEEGKIKFKEEELAVRDDYAETLPEKPTAPAKDFIPPAPPPIVPTNDGVPDRPATHELDMNNPQVIPVIDPHQPPPIEDHNESVPPPSGR